MVENNLDLRAIYSRYQEIYNLDGLAFTLIASFAVFAMALCAVRGIAWTINDQRKIVSTLTGDPCPNRIASE
jgi:hypothetical protein